MTPDSRASDSRDRRARKVSQVSPGSQELLEDQADQEWMDSPASRDFLDLKESPALDFLALQVYREYPGLKASLGQRVIPDSQAAPAPLDGTDSMVVQELKVNLDYLEYPEPEDHLETLFRPPRGSQAHPGLQARSDHQVTPEGTVPKETPVHQAWISRVCPEIEEVPVSLDPRDQLELQDHQEDLD